uniref:Uncharacterized protein n=1 Tax=Anguilla anguilla TaxID=7936 RepID=A0A0E9US84_ANGAN
MNPKSQNVTFQVTSFKPALQASHVSSNQTCLEYVVEFTNTDAQMRTIHEAEHTESDIKSFNE